MLLVAIPVGIIAGVALRKLKPEWCKNYAKFSMHRKWWLFLLGFVLFVVMAYRSFASDDIPYGIYFSLFALFELVVVFKYGFKPLTPEMREKIEKSDPTKLFHKNPKGS